MSSCRLLYSNVQTGSQPSGEAGHRALNTLSLRPSPHIWHICCIPLAHCSAEQVQSLRALASATPSLTLDLTAQAVEDQREAAQGPEGGTPRLPEHMPRLLVSKDVGCQYSAHQADSWRAFSCATGKNPVRSWLPRPC